MSCYDNGIGNSGDNLSAADIPSADEFDVTGAPDGTVYYSRTAKFLTEFGKAHGGGQMAMMWLMIVSSAALLVAIIVAPFIGDSGWSMEARGAALVGCLSLFALIDIVVLFLYFRLRLILMLAAALVAFCLLASFGFALLDWLMPS